MESVGWSEYKEFLRRSDRREKRLARLRLAFVVVAGFLAGWVVRSLLDWSQYQNMFGPTL